MKIENSGIISDKNRLQEGEVLMPWLHVMFITTFKSLRNVAIFVQPFVRIKLIVEIPLYSKIWVG